MYYVCYICIPQYVYVQVSVVYVSMTFTNVLQHRSQVYVYTVCV